MKRSVIMIVGLCTAIVAGYILYTDLIPSAKWDTIKEFTLNH